MVTKEQEQHKNIYFYNKLAKFPMHLGKTVKVSLNVPLKFYSETSCHVKKSIKPQLKNYSWARHLFIRFFNGHTFYSCLQSKLKQYFLFKTHLLSNHMTSLFFFNVFKQQFDFFPCLALDLHFYNSSYRIKTICNPCCLYCVNITNGKLNQ